jgi:hypothetical protein
MAGTIKNHLARAPTRLDSEEDNMRDKKLTALVVLLIVLSLGHEFDHIARGDIRWQLLPIVIFLAEFAFFGLALFFYLKNKLGPLFWAIAAGMGVAFGWLAHFSPFTDQTPQYIYHAYATPAAGWLAVAWLVALMLALITTSLYAEYLWAKGIPR